MSVRMEPMRDEAGNLRPDLDYRHVTVKVMAAYLGIDRTTLYRRWTLGFYPRNGGRTIGRCTYFSPRVMLELDHEPALQRGHG